MGNRQRKGGERREGGVQVKVGRKLERSRPRCFLMTSGNFILAKMRT